MIKVLSAILILAIVGSEARSNQWFYSPYSNKLTPIDRSIALSNKMSNKMAALSEMQAIKRISPKVLPEVPMTAFKEDFCRGQAPESKIKFPGNNNKFIVCHLGETFDIMTCPRHLVFNVHTGNCENSHKKPVVCKANTCKNGGKCIELPLGGFKCECLPGFGGRVCESSRACEPNTCGSHGTCFELSHSSLQHYCLCDNGLTYGLSCDSKTIPNPCMDNAADLHSFPTIVNESIFVQCEGHIPHMKTCAFPLVYSHELQRCDWE